ncbi:MAG: hypothetical protein DRR42_25280 [Gammaproteobacteria bacterium]|nr:MAG: hypothetical protein DRR42_25280 [Gammaproteobacteria bacterium]
MSGLMFEYLKKRVIEQAVKQINNHSDLQTKCKFESRKTGRAITHLCFSINKNTKNKPHPSSSKNPLKYLSPEAVYNEFQKPRYRSVANYYDGFKMLKNEGYTFDQKAFLKKYNH